MASARSAAASMPVSVVASDRASGRGVAILWVAMLAGVSAAVTLGLACATPFVALAALAGMRLRLRDGMALMVIAWASSQMIGFAVLHYPRDPVTVAWGGAMLSAALAALGSARWGGGKAPAGGAALASGFGAGFVAYKLVLLGWSFVLGGVHTALSPYWTAQQFGREALILIGLALGWRLLVRAGVPAPVPAAA